MNPQERHKPMCKIWLEYQGLPVLGKGGADILKAIKKTESITRAAESVGMSYRYVWNYLAKTAKAVGAPIVHTHRGGKQGGWAKLTSLGESLLKEYKRVEDYVGGLLDDQDHWMAVGLKLSARNRLKGAVEEVEKGAVAAKVRIRIDQPATVTALISKEAVEELDIQAGDMVEAVIKATEVMVAKEKRKA